MHSQIVTNYDTTGRFFRGSFLDKLIFRGKNWPSRSFVVAMACSIVSHAKNRSSKVATEGRIAEFSPLKKRKPCNDKWASLDLHKYNTNVVNRCACFSCWLMTWLAYNGLKKTLPHIIMIRKSFHEWKENKKGFVIKLYKKIMRWVIKLSYFSISLATLNYVFLIDLDFAITKLLVRFFVQSFLTFYILSTKYFSTLMKMSEIFKTFL